MKTYVTFGQKHIHRINNLVFDKDCIAVVNGNRDKVFEIFGARFAFEYLDINFDINGIHLYPRGLIEVPDDIIIKMTIDPLDKFEDLYNDEQIYNLLGTLPYWTINPDYLDKPLKEALDSQYGFGLFEATGQTITKDGIYQYPEDPDLYPLIKIVRHDETFYQYQYAMVAIVQKDGNTFVTRMD